MTVAEGLAYRPVQADELERCAGIWRESINAYIRPLGQIEIGPDTAPLIRLYGHLSGTDPERFVVGVQRDPETGSEEVVAFASALVRERLWFLSMLFVLPGVQASGVGRALLARVMPAADSGMVLGTATDSAQPISNALYSTYGIVPRVPLLNLIGLPDRPEAFGELPSGVRALSFEAAVDGGGGDGQGHRELSDAVDALDREVLGVAHPIDHRYLRQEARHGWLYVGPDGSVLAYGYAGEAGRVGPVASRDADLVAPILGHLTREVVPRGAFAMWLPGSADRAVVAALHAGFRLEPFPVLLCWDRPFGDFSRYLPISPGLL